MRQQDPFDLPGLHELENLVVHQIPKVNSDSSPGFDCVAVPLIKYAVRVVPDSDVDLSWIMCWFLPYPCLIL